MTIVGGGGEGGVRSEKLSHKNAIKYEKADPIGFLTPQVPSQKNLAKTLRTPLPPAPLDFQVLCIYVANCLNSFFFIPSSCLSNHEQTDIKCIDIASKKRVLVSKETC
jgi:hypothetical protein